MLLSNKNRIVFPGLQGIPATNLGSFTADRDLYLQSNMLSEPLYNEAALLKLVSDGDLAAFRDLFDRHRNKVYYVAREILQSSVAAEDAVQEIFLKIWLNNKKLASVNNFTAYLNTVTRNHIYNMLRKQAGENKLLRELIEYEIKPGNSDTLDTVALHELQQLLHQAAATLSPQQRKVFEMSRLEGLKQEEIAKQLQLSKETVKKYLADALQKIKKYLGHQGKGMLLILLVISGN